MEVDTRHRLNETPPSLTRLLHTSLKRENMTAIVRLGSGDDWYGAVQSTFEPKTKRSYLSLLIFAPGQEDLNNIITKIALKKSDAAAAPEIKQAANSYTKGCIVWYRENNLVVCFLLLLNQTSSSYFRVIN